MAVLRSIQTFAVQTDPDTEHKTIRISDYVQIIRLWLPLPRCYQDPFVIVAQSPSGRDGNSRLEADEATALSEDLATAAYVCKQWKDAHLSAIHVLADVES